MDNAQNERNTQYSQLNAYAMYHGVFLGIFGVLTLACYVLSFSYESLSLIFMVAPVISLFLARTLTIRYREASGYDIAQGFGFGRAFSHTLLMGFYAGLWVALAVFIYLRWIDQGFLFNCMEVHLGRPEMIEMLQQSGVPETFGIPDDADLPSTLANVMRSVSPITYAVSFLYFNILLAPILSVLVALFCIKRPRTM